MASVSVHSLSTDVGEVSTFKAGVSGKQFTTVDFGTAPDTITVFLTPESLEAIGREWVKTIQCDTGYAGHCSACDVGAAVDFWLGERSNGSGAA